MAVNWDTFQRYQQKGLDARRAGQWEQARIYLLEAARAILELSKQAQGEELKNARRETANKLLELARDCEKAKSENRRSPGAARGRGGGGGGGAGEQSSEAEGGGDGSQWIVKEKPSIRFADVAGLDEVKEDIRLKMIYPFEHPELAARFDIRAGGGILLYGPPGTGKTMLAKATAGEIEALVPARRDEGSSVMQRVVPQILQGVEGFDKKAGRPILLMGATNVPWQLDPAMLRPGRFDEKVYIPLPDLPARRKMLDLYLAKRPVADAVDLDALAARLDGYSGADIKYLCDRAATIPFLQSVASGQEGEITTAILDDALADTPRSVTPEALKRFDEWASAAARG